MSAPRNFRKILDVDPQSPQFHCVGETKKGGKCGQSFFSRDDLAQAGALLTKMDSKSLKSSYRYLDDLAYLTLCPRWHRKPGYSQVTSVSQRWRLMIQQYEVEEAYLEWSTTAAQRKQVKVKKERQDKITATSVDSKALERNGKTMRPSAADTKPVDPFVTSSTATQAITPENPFTRRLKASMAQDSNSYLSSSASLPRLASGKAKSDKQQDPSTPLIQASDLPSPPNTPLAIRRRNSRETKERITVKPEPIAVKKEPIAVKEEPIAVKEEPIAVETEPTESENKSPEPFKVDKHPDLSTPILGLQQLPPSPLNLEVSPRKIRHYRPETPKATPEPKANRVEEFKSRSKHNTPPKTAMESKANAVGGFEFGSTYSIPPKTFEFKLPLQPVFDIRLPEKQSTISDDVHKEETKVLPETILASPEAPAEIPISTAKSLPETSLESSGTGVETPISTTETALPTIEVPQTPVRTPEQESFGTATITSSTRSRIYLPATQQYGLMTPPDEPDTWDTPRIRFGGPITGKDDFASPSPDIHHTPSTASSKPVDSPDKNLSVEDPTTKREEGEKIAPARFAACGHLSPPSGQDCACGGEAIREDVRPGCLHGMRRLRKMVVRKVEYLSARSPWSKEKGKKEG